MSRFRPAGFLPVISQALKPKIQTAFTNASIRGKIRRQPQEYSGDLYFELKMRSKILDSQIENAGNASKEPNNQSINIKLMDVKAVEAS